MRKEGTKIYFDSHEEMITLSRGESCTHVLRGLISYHERMTMGNYPERDFYLDALRYALSLVEKEMKSEART